MSELLTRLNPKTARFDIGSGGTQELSDQDIAAALGMVQNKLGGKVLMRMHCPGMLDWRQLDLDVFDLVRSEYIRRENLRINDQLRMMLSNGRGTLNVLRGSLNAGIWPKFHADRYMALVRAVIQEIIHGDVCEVCKGKKKAQLEASGEVIVCGHCKGTGIEPEPIRRRSKRMGLTHRAFTKAWTDVYRWVYSELMQAQITASSEFRHALGRAA
jgi:hypothetical protein